MLEHGHLYQFEFRKRGVGAYRSMGAKRDEYGTSFSFQERIKPMQSFTVQMRESYNDSLLIIL